MAELADVQDLGSCAERLVGSTPTNPTLFNFMKGVNTFKCLIKKNL